MSDLKVGDKVRVEFEGVVDHVNIEENTVLVVHKPDLRANWLPLRLVQKLVAPEPEWVPGDVVRTNGVIVIFDGQRWNVKWPTHNNTSWSPLDMTRSWQRGDVVRLLPEESVTYEYGFHCSVCDATFRPDSPTMKPCEGGVLTKMRRTPEVEAGEWEVAP